MQLSTGYKPQPHNFGTDEYARATLMNTYRIATKLEGELDGRRTGREVAKV